MTRAETPMPIVERDGMDGQELPIVVVHDTQVEQLMRQWEAEREAAKPPQPAPRPTLRREPYAYD